MIILNISYEKHMVIEMYLLNIDNLHMKICSQKMNRVSMSEGINL